MKNLKSLLFSAVGLLCSTSMSAHDFEVDGIYYNITSAEDKTVEVTYEGSSVYSANYSGSVTIPEIVTYNENTYSVNGIGSAAFYHCFGLTSVVIPNSVTSIGYSAFSECSLTSVVIPNSVTSIGELAFSKCSLTSVEIPNSVTSIGESAFAGCSLLTSIIVAEDNSTFDSRDNCNAIIEIQTNTLIAGCSNTTIPNSVTSIGTHAFSRCSNLTSVAIPNSVTSIGDYAFYECSSLTSVEIGNSVTSIGEHAFSYCSSLTSVAIPNSMTSIGDWTFYFCSGLTSVVIGNSVTSIGEHAFSYCSSLTSVVIPNSVTSIGGQAFQSCSGLSSVEIGNSVTSIENHVFSGCSSLTSVVIPNSVTSIGLLAFESCSSLTSVEIPNSVTSIGNYAFSGCSGLTSIVVAEDNPIYDSRDNCNAIIETQTNTLIRGCSETTIPNSVTSIGKHAFTFCDALIRISIPNSVTSIGNYTFGGCDNLTAVEIPNSVTTIGGEAFRGCYSLTSITSYISADKLFEIESDVFEGIDKTNCTLYVPYGAQETYAATAGWSDFTNIVEITDFDLTVSNAEYSTLYLDCAAEIPTGVEVYIAQAIEGDRLMMKLVEGGEIPANTGVLVKLVNGTQALVGFNYTETEAPAIADNLFSGSATTKYVSVPSNKTAFVLSSVDGNVGMYLAKLTDGQFLNNTNKAYLLLSKDKLGISEDEVDTSIGGMQLSLRFDFNGSTGIDGVQTEINTQGAIYDLYGRKLQSATTPGLYIINGKKVWVK